MNHLPAPSSDGNPPPQEAPFNLDAEQGLLGALLLFNTLIERVPTLKPDHFYDPLHADIFDAIHTLVVAGKTANPVTLKAVFEAYPPISESLTVVQYLGRLAANATSAANVAEYGRLIIGLATRRTLILICAELEAAAKRPGLDQDPSDLIVQAERALYAVSEASATAAQSFSIRDAVDEAMRMANEAYKRAGKLAGLSTGYVDLDEKLGGLQNSDLIILAGRPAMGKTALATNIAKNVAKSMALLPDGREVPQFVDIYSMEMSGAQLAMRLVSEECGISSDRLRRGDFSEEEFRQALQGAAVTAHLPINIDVTGGLSIGALATRARRIKRQKGTSLIIVDYLQLMTGSGRRDNRVQEITEITTGLKALAKELGVPIIALSQLSRRVEERQDKRPQLSDLRESGSIEQDADVVLFVFRDDYYLNQQQPDMTSDDYAEWQKRMQTASGKAEVIIAKQRHGPTGLVHMAFDAKLTRFSNLADGGRYAA